MEHRNCQNCKKEFEITPDDFSFYEKIKVPPPTFCRWCRLMRRFLMRNERTYYRSVCGLCHKNIISMYHPSSPFPVYCRECWNGDGWNAITYARKYDMSRSFFEQYKEFSDTVPRLALWQRNAVNSDYSNMAVESKNVYLSVSVVKDSENVFYSKFIDTSRDIVDCFKAINNSEGLYENVEAQSNYNCQYTLITRNCIDSFYLVDCANCSNCFMSYNLRNKQYCIRNTQYSKEDYLKEIQKYNLGSRKVRQDLLKEYEDIKLRAVYRFSNFNKVVDSTGNDLFNTKNCKFCFEVNNAENLKYCYRSFDMNDCMDFDYGQRSELLYEYSTGALDDFNVKFSFFAIEGVRNADYTELCKNCTDIFGCISLKNTNYAIFNNTYSKEEYFKLREEIIAQMSTVPFIDKKGRRYSYGEFFPIQLAPFGYNETLAGEFMPISKEEALENGYPWRDEEKKDFQITMSVDKIPEDINQVNDDILKEVLECAHKGECANQQCSTAFRLTDFELKFYKKYNIPLPTICSNCRYYERIKVLPAINFWHRLCMNKGCKNEFETPYAPDRPEKVFCESCYNKEVY
jgi:hypothetical protein